MYIPKCSKNDIRIIPKNVGHKIHLVVSALHAETLSTTFQPVPPPQPISISHLPSWQQGPEIVCRRRGGENNHRLTQHPPIVRNVDKICWNDEAFRWKQPTTRYMRYGKNDFLVIWSIWIVQLHMIANIGAYMCSQVVVLLLISLNILM